MGALALLTRDDQDYAAYVEAIVTAGGPSGEIARAVKTADLRHNLGRLVPELEHLRARYEAALDRLAPEAVAL